VNGKILTIGVFIYFYSLSNSNFYLMISFRHIRYVSSLLFSSKLAVIDVKMKKLYSSKKLNFKL